jgi:hypothetical protein
MSDDPRTDFFASGDTSAAADQDARTAFFASDGQSDTTSTPVTYDAAEFKRRVGREPEPAELANFKAFKGVGFAGDPTQGKFTMGQAAVGGAEDALSLATGAPASIAAAGGYLYGLTGAGGSDSLSAARAARNALTYQPRTEAGQAGMETLGQIKPGEIVPRLLDVAGAPNAAQTVREVEERTGDVAPLLGEAAAGFPVTRAIGRVAGSVISSMADPEAAVELQGGMNSPQSMGAARSAPPVEAATPELQDAIRTTAQQTGGAVNPDALNRQLEADSLPVPMQLTKGQALQDPARISFEQNMRGQQPELGARFSQQNGQLVQNLESIRGQVGPDVFTSNPVDHADTLIDAYKAKDQVARTQIDEAYDTARKSLTPNTPVMDASQLRTNVHQILEDKWATESAPPDIVKRLDALADGNGVITAGQLEGLRTRLADLSRSSDGSARYAAHLIRGAVEDQDLLPGTESFKAPFDEARGLARARFQTMETDPAYNAAVNGTVPADRFIQKFIVGGTRDGLARMRANFADNPTATQTMSVAALDHLRRASGIDDMGNGNFSQANFNKNLQAIAPKFPSLFDHATRENLSTLGNVARYTQFQPRGSFVNNSNTFTAAAAEAGKTALEGAANVAAKGIPVGTWIRKGLQGKAARDFARESLRPGAGIEELQQK